MSKARVVKEGKIPKPKPLPLVGEGEVLFEVPEGWVWVRLPEAVTYEVGKTPPTRDPRYWTDHGIPWVSIGDMPDGGTVKTTSRTVTEAAAAEVFQKLPIPAGTLLMSFKLTIGKVAILGLDAYHNEAIISIRPFRNVNRDYLFYCLPLLAQGGESKKAIKGATLNGESLARLLIPLPPLPEQHRIVAKVDALMALLDRLETARSEREASRAALRDAALAALHDAPDAETVEVAWSRIAERMDDLFRDPIDVAPLRQTILQLAVRGKLVAQDPNDEPACVLLGEHAMMLADSEPWRLPCGWAWSSMQHLGDILGGGTPSKSNSGYWRGDIPWVSPKDMKCDRIVDATDHITEVAIEGSSVRLIPAGALLMVVRGMILAHSFPTALTEVPVTINQDMKALVPFRSDLADYLLLVSKGLRDVVLRLVERSTHGTCKLSSDSLFALPLPLPPLPEQHRIVAKVNALMALCDALEARLAAAREAQAAFAAAAVHHLEA